MGLFNLFGDKKMELSEFIPKFLQTIVSSRVLHDIPPDQFSATEIKRIHKELRLLRYAFFYFFVSDTAKSGYIDGLTPQNAEIVDTIFDRSLEPLLVAGNSMDTLGEVKIALQDYKSIADSKGYKDYAERGYFYVVAHCLERCGYKMPTERKNNVDPVTKEEEVFDMVNQTYLALQEAFAKTVRNYPVYFKSNKSGSR